MPFESLDRALTNMGISGEGEAVKVSRCYSGHEIVLLATEIEKMGYVFYKHAAKLAPTNKLRDIFNVMASDELDHIRILHDEVAPKFKKADHYWENDEAVAHYLTSILNPRIFPGKDKLKEKMRKVRTEEATVDLCIEGELKSIEFYNSLMELSKCEEGMDAIRRILEEEKKHVEKLEDIKQKL